MEKADLSARETEKPNPSPLLNQPQHQQLAIAHQELLHESEAHLPAAENLENGNSLADEKLVDVPKIHADATQADEERKKPKQLWTPQQQNFLTERIMLFKDKKHPKLGGLKGSEDAWRILAEELKNELDIERSGGSIRQWWSRGGRQEAEVAYRRAINNHILAVDNTQPSPTTSLAGSTSVGNMIVKLVSMPSVTLFGGPYGLSYRALQGLRMLFTRTYPEYEGSREHFFSVCHMLLQSHKKGESKFVARWDAIIIGHASITNLYMSSPTARPNVALELAWDTYATKMTVKECIVTGKELTRVQYMASKDVGLYMLSLAAEIRRKGI